MGNLAEGDRVQLQNSPCCVIIQAEFADGLATLSYYDYKNAPVTSLSDYIPCAGAALSALNCMAP